MSQVLASILYKAAREQSLVDPTKVEEILGIKEETAADPIADPQMTGTGRERLIRSHSSARFCFELSGNSN